MSPNRLGRLLRGACVGNGMAQNDESGNPEWIDLNSNGFKFPDNIFDEPSLFPEQLLVDAIIEATIYDVADRRHLRNDPLVRLLIHNPAGLYNFVVVSAAGVITEGMLLNFRSESALIAGTYK
jgi:hypothetical protein